MIIPIHCKNSKLDEGFWADLIVEDEVILEIEPVERSTPAYKKQILTYINKRPTSEMFIKQGVAPEISLPN